MANGGWVYIVANRKNGAIYIGVTNDLARRVLEHKEKRISGFTKKYGCSRLVWCEQFDRIEDAIRMEKRMKEWKRTWKVRLIEERNPVWDDLSLHGF
jgi:putative endonuclease|tara:strand:+ start:16784 stop:17074 length:291 start_codon:yes stop_codon:yes gene_type:complete